MNVLQICPGRLSDVATLPWEIQKIIFNSFIHTHFWLFTLSTLSGYADVHVKFSQDSTYRKLLNSSICWRSYSENKKLDVFVCFCRLCGQAVVRSDVPIIAVQLSPAPRWLMPTTSSVITDPRQYTMPPRLYTFLLQKSQQSFIHDITQHNVDIHVTVCINY